METFKAKLDEALRNVMRLKLSMLRGVGLDDL